MKPVLTIITSTAFAVLALACGAGSGPPDGASTTGVSPTEPSQGVSLGTWVGTGVDSNKTNVSNSTPIAMTIVTWTLTQTDASVSGTVTTQSTDTPNTTCNSCHRTKPGTLSGTITGTMLTWTMSFPGVEGNPTPENPTPQCAATLTGTVSLAEITEGSLTGSYTGDDECEGQFLAGTLTLAPAVAVH
jgi:hypothetical protein